MKPRSKPATKAEKARYSRLKEIGCIIAHVTKGGAIPYRDCRPLGCEIQHYTSGGRRIGNEKMVPLCPFHHRAQLPEGMTTSQATFFYGPSFAKSRREFEKTFGSEEFLLAETNKILEGM